MLGFFFTLPRKFGQAEIRGALCSGAIQHTIKIRDESRIERDAHGFLRVKTVVVKSGRRFQNSY